MEMEANKNWRWRRLSTTAMWFLLIAPSLASAEPNPAIRGADNSDVLKELGVDIQNDGKDERERGPGKSRRVLFCLNLGRKYFDLQF